MDLITPLCLLDVLRLFRIFIILQAFYLKWINGDMKAVINTSNNIGVNFMIGSKAK
jgi:hypothetical protein